MALPPRSCPEILLGDSNPRPTIERKWIRPGIEEQCFESCLSRRLESTQTQPRESQRSSQANRGWNFPIPPFNYVVKFKGIIRSIANSLQRWIPNLLLLPRSKAYSISPIFPRCTHIRIFRNIEFLSLEFVAKSGRIFRDKREYRSDIPSKRQSNPPPHSKLSPRQNISPIGMIHDLPVERRVQQREREIKEIRVDCVARRRTIRLEYTRFNRRRC